MNQNQPSAAAIRAAKRWRDLDLNGPISQPGSPTSRLAGVIDSEFLRAINALTFIREACQSRPGHIAYLSKSEIITICNEALASIEGTA